MAYNDPPGDAESGLWYSVETKCPVCNRLDEGGAHLFLKCKLAQANLEGTEAREGMGESVRPWYSS